MSKFIKNLGKITFKVKILDADAYHNVVLEWSEETQSYEGKQLFEQLTQVTRIPVKYTDGLWMRAGALYLFIENPDIEADNDSPIKYCQHTRCNDLVKEVVRIKKLYDCDSFILTFNMNAFASNHLNISYDLVPLTAVHGTECLGFCRFRNTKAILDKIRSIIDNDALNAEIINFRSAGIPLFDIYRTLNVFQLWLLPCGVSRRYSHLYLRNRG